MQNVRVSLVRKSRGRVQGKIASGIMKTQSKTLARRKRVAALKARFPLCVLFALEFCNSGTCGTGRSRKGREGREGACTKAAHNQCACLRQDCYTQPIRQL